MSFLPVQGVHGEDQGREQCCHSKVRHKDERTATAAVCVCVCVCVCGEGSSVDCKNSS